MEMSYHIQVAKVKASPLVAAKLYCHWEMILLDLRLRITVNLENTTS